MNMEKLLPVCKIEDLNKAWPGIEQHNLIENGACTAYYAVVIYEEDRICYIQNNRIIFPERLFELILHIAKADKKGLKGQEAAKKMKLQYKDVYNYKNRVNDYEKYRDKLDKDLIVINDRNYWHLNVDFTNNGLLII